MSRYDNLINGQWAAAEAYSPNINPSDLTDVIGEYAQGSAADVQAAIAAATPPRLNQIVVRPSVKISITNIMATSTSQKIVNIVSNPPFHFIHCFSLSY